ncbi:MAG: glycoside hydrolase family 5 protein [Chitinophagaceae bacterium]
MKKFRLLIILIGTLLFNVFSVNAQSIAWQRANKLGMGMNLSWLENYWNGSKMDNYEDYLDLHSIQDKKQQLSLIHQLGFKTLRLPVSFDHWTSLKPPYRIVKTNYFAAIDSILQWAKLYDLNVIIDDHNGSLDDSAKVIQKLPRLNAIWKQVATRYKNTDPNKVFFEIYNEPHNISSEQWKECALQLIKTIRSIAPDHTLIVGGVDWNSISGLQKLGKLPDNNIIYTFHFYDPFLFTHQGAAWPGVKATSNIHIPFPYNATKMPPLNPESIGTYGENNYKNYQKQGTAAGLKKELETAKSFSEKYNVPIFCGEWGSYKKYSDPESRCRYTATIKGLLEELHIPFAYWEWNQSFSLFNGEPSLQDISDCMKKAWGFK